MKSQTTDPSSPELFFITGRGRSGTWLLQSILDAHPEISVAPESVFIMMLHRRYERARWTPQRKASWVRDILADQKITKWWGLSEKELTDAVTALPPSALYADISKVPYQLYAQAQGRMPAHLGDKNPEYTLHIERLLDYYPEARCIVMLRDPRDNVRSFQKVDFDLDDAAMLAGRWCGYQRYLAQAIKRHPDQLLTVRYEDLCEHHVEVLERITAFIGAGYDEALERSHEQAQHVFSWNARVTTPVDPSMAYKWRDDPDQKQHQLVGRLCAHWLDAYGYDQPPAGRIGLWARIKYDLGRFTVHLEHRFVYMPYGLTRRLLRLYRRTTAVFKD